MLVLSLFNAGKQQISSTYKELDRHVLDILYYHNNRMDINYLIENEKKKEEKAVNIVGEETANSKTGEFVESMEFVMMSVCVSYFYLSMYTY